MVLDRSNFQDFYIDNLLSEIRILRTGHQLAKERYESKLAPNFNVFEFIKPNEMKLSEILVWLLRPDGSHGQGSIFLRLFLELVEEKLPTESCDKVKVMPESHIDEYGRLDIYLEFDDLEMAIENKPWANDQPEQ
jgi:hypothetical protein